MAFHEGFADLMAILQRFSYKTVVEEAIGQARGDLQKARSLADLAGQFGQTVAGRMARRSANDTAGTQK
jgi:hypothetical protein